MPGPRMGICIALAISLSIQGLPEHRKPSCSNNLKKIVIALLAGISFLLTSCGDTPECLAEDSMDVMKEITEVMKEVNEGGDPKDAAERIADLGEEMKDLENRMEKVEADMSEEEKKEFAKKMEDKYGEEMKEMMSEMMKLATSGKEGAKEFSQEIQKIMNDSK